MGIDRRTFLLGLGGGAVATVGGFTAFGSPHAVKGAVARIRRQARDYFRPSPRVSDPSVLDGAVFDVCIIGSGPAGAVLGKDLVDRGVRTVILESGPDPYRGAWHSRHSALEVYRSTGTLEYPVVATRARALGGSSILWTGRCVRLRPVDFEDTPYTANARWPIAFADLEPYYERADRTLRVTGGARMNDRVADRARDHSAIRSLMAEAGVAVDATPTSNGVWAPGPIRIVTDVLPAFAESEHATLVSGVTVTRLVADRRGHVNAVQVRTLDDARMIVEAGVVVVACGGIETTRLLLLSRSAAFRAGLGNDHGRVGRGFMEHPNLTFRGRLSRRIAPSGWARSEQFYEVLKRRGLGSVIMRVRSRPDAPDVLEMGFGIEMFPSDGNRVALVPGAVDYFGDPAAGVALHFSEADHQTLEAGRTLIRSIYADVGARDVHQEGELTWSHHHMGSCRMGDDPRTSVVDRTLRVHASPNLYLCSSAVFPTSGNASPTVAITALAHRLADHLSGGGPAGLPTARST